MESRVSTLVRYFDPVLTNYALLSQYSLRCMSPSTFYNCTCRECLQSRTEMDMGWVYPRVGLGCVGDSVGLGRIFWQLSWVGLGREKVTNVYLWSRVCIAVHSAVKNGLEIGLIFNTFGNWAGPTVVCLDPVPSAIVTHSCSRLSSSTESTTSESS